MSEYIIDTGLLHVFSVKHGHTWHQVFDRTAYDWSVQNWYHDTLMKLVWKGMIINEGMINEGMIINEAGLERDDYRPVCVAVN